jgi:hypothetical protein
VAAGAMAFALLPGTAFADSRDTDDICPPPGEGAEDVFDDLEGYATHAENINCAGQYEIVLGTGGGSYSPGNDVSRGQMASYISGLIETATGEELPAGDGETFDDIAGTTFETEIDQLANAEVVQGDGTGSYNPRDHVNRDQMATFIANAIDYVDDGETNESQPPNVGDDPAFDDVNANNAHVTNISRLEAQDIVAGTGQNNYSPRDQVTRAQMASFVMQGADYLDELGQWEPTAPVSNQAFSVTPSDDVTLAPNEQRSYEATGFGADSDEVVLTLADGDNVQVENDVVTFDRDGEVADFGDVDATLTGVEVDGTAFPGFQAGDSLTVDEDAEVTFTVAGDADQEVATDSVVPVVYEGDDELAVVEDGLPEADFGIGGQVDFAVERKASEIELAPEASINDLGASHTLTATVEDQFGDGVGDVEVDFAIGRDGSTIATYERTTDQDGEATLTYAGPSEQAVDTLTASFEVSDNGTTTGDEATATKWWIDLDAVDTIEPEEADVTADVGAFAYRVDVGFDVRNAQTVLWVENDRVFDLSGPSAESLYLDEGDRYADATVVVYYELDDGDGGTAWSSITVGYDGDGEVETIGGLAV